MKCIFLSRSAKNGTAVEWFSFSYKTSLFIYGHLSFRPQFKNVSHTYRLGTLKYVSVNGGCLSLSFVVLGTLIKWQLVNDVTLLCSWMAELPYCT